ncbi:hypothetical protein VSR01_17435 [Actinacidiphila sp. DG2A-62]|uniref:hypothetical protein n=1 Tax=Actinacidiphila sp. DG2A-62 TaxID=3108821 RepID=UPI002DB8B4BB|nr:hypothetical protein [Actinacidiphila sp. DG2A-62]MEC3995222.1 hypothetical protein [Actinacidiphila sp. DG2A-62]
MPATEAQTILDALAHSVAGDTERGLALLQPLVDAGPRSTYALLGSLAEVASSDAREASPGSSFGMEVIGPDGPADAELLPPPLRFAAHFVTAWANRDQDTAHALFWAVAEPSDRYGTDDLAEAIRAVFAMAAATAEYEVARKRRQREEGKTW